ncbi:MAG TPA: type II toxin-antitoxin system HicB family antitoxin [Tissierellia bacterium]|jgi:antitoxin HicB|nr:type II toxin-antitoxin system HicB family antitoxin [Tissierellia bacterium]
MKNEMDLKERNYKIEIMKLTDEDGGGFLAIVPALPGCMSDGETQEEALANVKDAIKCWIETAEEIGREIPREELYRSEDEYSGKLSLRIPKSLHKRISDIANKEGCSINQLIMMYISMGVGCEFGKKQVNITLNNPIYELPAIEELQREKWKDYININKYSSKQTNQSLFRTFI